MPVEGGGGGGVERETCVCESSHPVPVCFPRREREKRDKVGTTQYADIYTKEVWAHTTGAHDPCNF